MNASNAKDYLPLVQALADGRVIQARMFSCDPWKDCSRPDFTMDPSNYRIKPEPKEIWVNEWPEGKRIFHSYGDAYVHAMQYPLVRSTTLYREVIE